MAEVRPRACAGVFFEFTVLVPHKWERSGKNSQTWQKEKRKSPFSDVGTPKGYSQQARFDFFDAEAALNDKSINAERIEL
jgi:hypothetical protein